MSGPIIARYYDGETASVQEVSLRVTTGDVVIHRAADAAVIERWPIDQLSVLGDSGHEAAPPVIRRGSEARLVVQDPESRAQLVAMIPALRPLALDQTPAGRRVGLYATTLVAVIGAFWGAVEYGTRYVAPLLPHSLQARLGETVLDEILADKEECHGEAGLTAINRLANDLAHEAGYGHEVTVHIVAGGPVNAFTLPGGILVFFSDLIEQAKDSNQVAGVLAHEIGHVVLHHPTQGLVRAYGLDILFKALTGGYSDISTVGTGGTLLLALRNGRAAEREADATGLRLLEQRGLRADGVSGFFEQMLEKQPKDAAASAGIWSTHPPTEERIATTKRPPTGRPAFTAAEWKALRDVCK